uniref:Cobalamin adenosyltransferase-like domain-containing protein n=1 Tax=Pseudo-nitzschia australis TaxID=44445 RepID=A0A7S4ALG7_9STRA
MPTGAPASAALHVARTVCRRAERRLVPLVVHHKTCDPNALRYLNRLSDYFFVAARWVNYKEGQEEIEYRLNNDLYGSDDGSYDDGSDEYCDSDNDNNSGNDKTPVANTHDQRGRVHRSLTTTATK